MGMLVMSGGFSGLKIIGISEIVKTILPVANIQSFHFKPKFAVVLSKSLFRKFITCWNLIGIRAYL